MPQLRRARAAVSTERSRPSTARAEALRARYKVASNTRPVHVRTDGTPKRPLDMQVLQLAPPSTLCRPQKCRNRHHLVILVGHAGAALPVRFWRTRPRRMPDRLRRPQLHPRLECDARRLLRPRAPLRAAGCVVRCIVQPLASAATWRLTSGYATCRLTSGHGSQRARHVGCHKRPGVTPWPARASGGGRAASELERVVPWVAPSIFGAPSVFIVGTQRDGRGGRGRRGGRR